MEITAAKHFLVNFDTSQKQKFRLIGEQTATARNDVTDKKNG